MRYLIYEAFIQNFLLSADGKKCDYYYCEMRKMLLAKKEHNQDKFLQLVQRVYVHLSIISILFLPMVDISPVTFQSFRVTSIIIHVLYL